MNKIVADQVFPDNLSHLRNADVRQQKNVRASEMTVIQKETAGKKLSLPVVDLHIDVKIFKANNHAAEKYMKDRPTLMGEILKTAPLSGEILYQVGEIAFSERAIKL